MQPKIYIYGLGQVGSSLLHTFQSNNIIVNGVSSRRKSSFQELPKKMALKTTIFSSLNSLLSSIQQSDSDQNEHTSLIFLSILDDAIEQCVSNIKESQMSKSKSIHFIHCSAAKGLSAFKAQSMHNMHLFHPFLSIKKNQILTPNSVIGIEAQNKDIENHLQNIAEKCLLKVWKLKANQASQYHLAASLTANLSLALFRKSLSLLTDLDIDSTEASDAILSLWRSALINIEQKGANKALTGPLARGDAQSILHHLAVLDTNHQSMHRPKLAVNKDNFSEIYKRLSLELLKESQLSESKILEIKTILNS